MQDKNPNQRQTTQGQRREEGRQGTGTAVHDEPWRGETGRGEMGREIGREEERSRDERSRGFYANALRRMRERAMRRNYQHERTNPTMQGFGGTGFGWAEPSWGRGSYGTEGRERWGGTGTQDWRGQQHQGQTGFPSQEMEGRREWQDESSGGYGDRNWDRQGRMQQDWRQREQYGQPQGQYGQQQTGRSYGGQQQDWQQQQEEARRRHKVMEREENQGQYGEVQHSRWGGWAAPFFGLGRRQRTHWNREPYTVRDVMTKDPESVTAQTNPREVARIMRDENVGVLPVIDEQRRLQGIITDRDLVVRVLAEDRQTAQFRLEDIMSREVEAVTEDEDIHEVLDVMGRKQVRRLPVVDEQDRLMGIVSISDIAQKADYDEELQEALEKISSRRSFWSRLWS